MASKLLRVLLVCALAVAADESSVQWWSGSRSLVPCQVVGWERLQRRSPLPLDGGDDSNPRVFAWRHDGEEISVKRIASNGSLEIRKKSAGVDGVYQCSVKHSSGVVLGYPVLLKQTYIDKQFTSHPENHNVTKGQPVAFSCVISSAPEANVSWVKDKVPVLEDGRFHVLKNQLLILDAQPEDAGLYRCIATNTFANKTRASHRALLLVKDTSTDVKVDFLPLQHEEQTLVPRGGGAKLACPVIGRPRPELTWKLTPPGGRQGELDFTGEVLELSHAELDQEGVYTCSPSTDLGLVKTFNITISEPVTIVTAPKSRPVHRAGTARFSCEATGRPAPTVTWYKDGEPLALAGRRKLLKSATDERIDLVISSVTSEDAGIYQCFASNQVSTASAWASLALDGGGGGPAPARVSCRAGSARVVSVSWAHAEPERVVAYTLHTQPADEDGTSSPGQPHENTEEQVTLDRPLTPYKFQVRAYLKSINSEKNEASDMSDTLICQGQGVPIKLRKDQNGSILVTWKEFADQNPGVVQWILQHKVEEGSLEKNITLPSNTVNYTLPLSEAKFIRLLGSRTEEWLPQDLTLVPWTSSDDPSADLDDGSTPCHIKLLEATQISSTWASFKWECDNDDASERYTYIVCVSHRPNEENCQESEKQSTTFVDLVPGSEYELWVQARGGPFSQPLVFATLPNKSDHFKNLTFSMLNTTCALVSWLGPAIEYKVQYSSVLRLPVDVWTSFNGYGNSVFLYDLAENQDAYVILTDLATAQHSKVLTIPKRTPDKDLPDLQYKYVEEGILISWESEGGFVVRYAQDLAVPLDQWTEVPANTTSLYLRNLDPKLSTYVMVHMPGSSDKSRVLTVPPAPGNVTKDEAFTWYHVLAACIFVVMALCALGAYCLWRRGRRRTTREDNAEMKEMTTLSNGGVGRDAGEPLLNGHLIQDGPPQIVPKTPNGKMRRTRQYEVAFDVSRSEDPDTTLDTVVEADITLDTRRADTSTLTATTNLSNLSHSETTLPNLLDTSRKPEFEITSDFAKLPDDNMNSELNRSVNFSKKVNTKTPTLQPNG